MICFLNLTTLCGCQRQLIASDPPPHSVLVRMEPRTDRKTGLETLDQASAKPGEVGRVFVRVHGNSTESFYLEVAS